MWFVGRGRGLLGRSRRSEDVGEEGKGLRRVVHMRISCSVDLYE